MAVPLGVGWAAGACYSFGEEGLSFSTSSLPCPSAALALLRLQTQRNKPLALIPKLPLILIATIMPPIFGSGNWSDMFRPEYGFVILTGTASGERESCSSLPLAIDPVLFSSLCSLHGDLEGLPGGKGPQEVQRQVPQGLQRRERGRQRLQLHPGKSNVEGITS